MHQLSIIIPHYNSVESTIRLIDTIPDDQEIQVLIVDDQSTVSLIELERKVVERTNIILLHNESSDEGAGVSRNIGLKNSDGNWVLFSDADDLFMNGWYGIIKEYFDSDADMVYFPPTSLNYRTGEKGYRHVHYERLVMQAANLKNGKAIDEMKYGFYTPWSKMIRKSIIDENTIWFDESIVANDVMAMTKMAYYSKKTIADQRIVYSVSCGEKSLTTSSAKDNEKYQIRVSKKIERYQFLRGVLDRKTFKRTHIKYYMAGSVIDALFSRNWGKIRYVLRSYHENHIHFITKDMINPVYLHRFVIPDLRWRKEIKSV